MTEDEAHDSVVALIDDLKYVMDTRPHEGWPSLARAAIDHHTPPIPDSILGWQDIQLQAAAVRVLDGLAASEVSEIREGIIDLRTIEALAVAPPPGLPTPPQPPTRRPLPSSPPQPARPRPQPPSPPLSFSQ